MRIGQPEGLIIHEELDDLAVGHVADRLDSFGEAVSLLALRVSQQYGWAIPFRNSWR